jgi:hypothetical protein
MVLGGLEAVDTACRRSLRSCPPADPPMYPDRLVIKNPGGLFGPVTIDSLGEQGISSAPETATPR